MIEHRLHQRLAVVEGAFDRERVHVCVRRRGHHAPLHVGDAAVREQHDHVDLRAAAERLDRGAAGVARGRHHDGGALAALGSTWSISRASSCMARSLKASVGP